MSKRAKEKAELIANGIMISVQGRMGRVVYNTAEKSFNHHDLMSAAQRGYEQAEKDLALTWEDIKKIDSLSMEVTTLFVSIGRNKDILERPYYEEVARRFNEQRKK